MKNILFICLVASVVLNAKGQITILNEQNITYPSVPVPTGTTIDLTNNTPSPTQVVVEYNAENEINIIGDANGFWVKPCTNGTSSYFLARIIPNLAYAELKETLDAGFIGTRGGVLHFKYIEKYQTGPLKYQIYNYQRNEMIPLVNQPILTKTLGANFFTLNLGLLGNFVGTNETDSYYILEVTNEKGEKSLLRFKYITSLNNN